MKKHIISQREDRQFGRGQPGDKLRRKAGTGTLTHRNADGLASLSIRTMARDRYLAQQKNGMK